MRVNGHISGVTFFGLSLVETKRLDGIEAQLKQANLKLDALLRHTVPPEKLVELTQAIDAAKATSDALDEVIEDNK